MEEGEKGRKKERKKEKAPFCFNEKYSQSVESLSCVQLFVTPWTAAHQKYNQDPAK